MYRPHNQDFDDAQVDTSELQAALNGGNRRLVPRVSRSLALRYETPRGVVGAGRTLDLSRTGARVVLYRYEDGDGSGVFRFLINGCLVEAQAVWRQPLDAVKGVVAGVRFLLGNPLQRANLQQILQPLGI